MAETVLITGTTSGIGHELARLFAKNGFNLITVARNIDKLREDAKMLTREYGVVIDVIQKDLAYQNAGKELYDEVKSTGHNVDILVNNAGVGVWGEFSETDINDEINMINLNLVTPTVLTKFFLNDMRDQNRGRIMNLASLASFQPGPLMSLYYATKAYILHFTEAIAEELKDTNITVTALCPGPTDTYFEERSDSETTRMFQTEFMVMNAKEVAEIGYSGLMDGKRIIIPGLKNQLMRQIERILPRDWLASIYEGMNTKVN